ncbi:MAG: hypothetical protein KC417_10615 [Myxococcales bacterium]|nr:hypothetical protein [Myxococcales bacterium]
MAEDNNPQSERRELTAEEQAQLEELDKTLERLESQKKWSEYIRKLIEKANLVVDPEETIDLLTKAGALYVDRSANQAEAIKCYERVLELSPTHREAIGRLKEMYEKRRDWEHWIQVCLKEADLLEDEGEKLMQIESLAEMANDKVRKPQVCIELWQRVLDGDPTNPKALAALASLYERARD